MQLRHLAPVAIVIALVLLGAVAAGLLLDSPTFSDADAFAEAGRVMLSGDWRHTYSDPWNQAGPFELLVCVVGAALGGLIGHEPIAFNLVGAAALVGAALRILGVRWRELLVVGAVASALGVISAMWEIGHPSQLFIALVWAFAARAARDDRPAAAAVLLGLSAGFETWGLLGAPILFLLPSLRRTVAGGLLALAVAAAVYAPFVLGGDFNMFELHWRVAGGIPALLLGQGAHFTWPMRLAQAIVVVGLGSTLALLLRRRVPAAWWIVPAATSFARVLLDPVRYPYYWDPGLVLILLGSAPWWAAPRHFVESCRERLREFLLGDGAWPGLRV